MLIFYFLSVNNWTCSTFQLHDDGFSPMGKSSSFVGLQGGVNFWKQISKYFYQVALCSLSYGHTPSVNNARKRPECVQSLRKVLCWMRERLNISMDRDKKAVHSLFWMLNCWPLAIPILSLMTSSWPGCWLWGISYVSKLLVMSVDTILVLPFLVLWHEVLKKQDGENKRFAQHICPRSLLSTTAAFNEVVTV